jgi:hypothetical protein
MTGPLRTHLRVLSRLLGNRLASRYYILYTIYYTIYTLYTIYYILIYFILYTNTGELHHSGQTPDPPYGTNNPTNMYLFLRRVPHLHSHPLPHQRLLLHRSHPLLPLLVGLRIKKSCHCLFIQIPYCHYAKDKIWFFKLVDIYGIWHTLTGLFAKNVFAFSGIWFILYLVSMTSITYTSQVGVRQSLIPTPVLLLAYT